MSDDASTFLGSSVLRNKLNITDAATLGQEERQWVIQRAREGIPTGNFDLPHLCAIHRRLAATDVLRGLTRTAFAQAAGAIMGDVHPFREGNGRTQLYFLEQLAE